MWIDETDTTQLAQRMRVGPLELAEAIGGPWHVVSRIDERESEEPGTLLVGRAGPIVAILVSDDVDPVVTVGHAVGHWPGPGTLQWSITDALASFDTPPAGAPSADVDRLLADLGAAVDAAFDRSRSTLVICRYCGGLVAPEHATGDELCSGCASSVFGIVF
jgi:hypothetical protein